VQRKLNPENVSPSCRTDVCHRTSCQTANTACLSTSLR
jgi:hypothetical protein